MPICLNVYTIIKMSSMKTLGGVNLFSYNVVGDSN